MSFCSLALGHRFRHRADDESAGETLGQQLLQLVAETFALRFVFDALRNADV